MILKEKCSIDKDGIYYILTNDFDQNSQGFFTGDRLRTYNNDKIEKEYIYVDTAFKETTISGGSGGGGAAGGTFETWTFTPEEGTTFTKEVYVKS